MNAINNNFTNIQYFVSDVSHAMYEVSFLAGVIQILGIVTGKEILVYMGPRPPVGIHRYILVLFQQKGPLGQVQQPASRANFSTRLFAQHLNLGLPVATVYFNAQKEPVSRRR